MKPRNARLLDDLLGRTNSKGVGQFIRDGHSVDLAEVLGGLEGRLHLEEAQTALVAFASMLIEARPPNGFDATRDFDRRKDGMLAELAERDVRRDQAVDKFVTRVLATVRSSGKS